MSEAAEERNFYQLFISKKNFLLVERDAHTSVADACWLLANRLLINDSNLFALYSLNSSGQEKLLNPSDRLIDIESSWEDPEDNAFFFHKIGVDPNSTALPILMPDGSMSIFYADVTAKSLEICEYLTTLLPPTRTAYFLYELHVADGKFLHRRIGAGELACDVYETFPDQFSSFPYKSMLALRERDVMIDIRNNSDGTTMHVRAQPFETCADIIERIVNDKALAPKAYEIWEAITGTEHSRRIRAYEALPDVVASWKGDKRYRLEFHVPLSEAAVRILIWDGSYKAVPIGGNQVCKSVLKALAEKLHSKKWWNIALYLISGDDEKRLVGLDERPLTLLQADATAKLICEEEPDAIPPVEKDNSEPRVVDPADLVDPALRIHTDVYLRLRAASFERRLVDVAISITPLPARGSGAPLAIAAENTVSVQVDVATSSSRLMQHLKSEIMPSLSPELFKLVVVGPKKKPSDFIEDNNSSAKHPNPSDNIIRHELSDLDCVIGALLTAQNESSDPAQVQLVLQYSPPMLDSDELDMLDEEAAAEEKLSDENISESILIFFNKESFVQLTISANVTARWVLNQTAAILGVDASEYSLFETGGGDEKLLDDSTRMYSIVQTWKMSSKYDEKTRAFAFRRKLADIRESVRMGLSSVQFDTRALNLVRSTDLEDEDDDGSKGQNGTMHASKDASKHKKIFSRVAKDTSPPSASAGGDASPRRLSVSDAGKRAARKSSREFLAVSAPVSAETTPSSARRFATGSSSAVSDLEAALADIEEDIEVVQTTQSNPVSPKTSPLRAEKTSPKREAEPADEKAPAAAPAESAPAPAPTDSKMIPVLRAASRPISNRTDRRSKGDFGTLRDRRQKHMSIEPGMLIKSPRHHINTLDDAIAEIDRPDGAAESGELTDSQDTAVSPPSKHNEDKEPKKDKKKEPDEAQEEQRAIEKPQKRLSASDSALASAAAIHQSGELDTSESETTKPLIHANSDSSISSKLEDSQASELDASLEESGSEQQPRSAAAAAATLQPTSSTVVAAKSPTWLLSESDVAYFGNAATTCFATIFDLADVESMSSAITGLAVETKKQIGQLKYFEEHGPLLAAALQAQLKALVSHVRALPADASLQTVSEQERDNIFADCRQLSGAVCAFLELFSYATESSVEEQTNSRVHYLASLLAKILSHLTNEEYDQLPEVGARVLAGSVRIALLLRIRSHLSFTEDRKREIRQVALQIKQSAYSMAGFIKTIAESQDLEDVDAIKQDVRTIATLLQQVPTLAQAEASSSSESAKLLPEKSILMTRLYMSIKELLASLGTDHEHLSKVHSSLQAILEAIKKVNEGGVMPSISKFLHGVVEFSDVVQAICEKISSEVDKTAQDIREKVDAFENSILIERVQLVMLSNMVVSDPTAMEKLQLLLHHVGAILQLIAESVKLHQEK